MKAISASILALTGAVLLVTNKYEFIGWCFCIVGVLAWAFLMIPDPTSPPK